MEKIVTSSRARQARIRCGSLPWLGMCRGVGLLVEANDVAAGVPESRRHLGRVHAYRLHNLAPARDDRVDGRANIVDHDVKQQARRCPWWSSADPSAAHLPCRVVEGSMTIAPLSYVPAEHLLVEVRRATDVGRGHFEVAHFAIR